MAAEALQLAVTASHAETRAAFFDSAASWLSLAIEVEGMYPANNVQPGRKAARQSFRSGKHPRTH
jgi:hypothetical protein